MQGSNLLNWRDFERDLKTASRSKNTIISYRDSIAGLLAFTAGEECANGCGHAHVDSPDLETLSKQDVADYIIHVAGTRSDATALVRFRSLRRFYNWAVKEEIIQLSPMRNLDEPRPEKKIVAVAPVDDVIKVLEHCRRCEKTRSWPDRFSAVRDRAIIRLFCAPGSPRVNEMASITVDRVDMRRDVVSFLGKGAKWRAIPFGAKTGKALTQYMRLRAKHPLLVGPRVSDAVRDALWLGWRQQQLTGRGIYGMVKRRCEEAGVGHIHPHQLRHLAVHLHFADGGTEQEAMHLFGWDTPQMAHHYAQQFAKDRAIDAARRRAVDDQI